MTLQTTRITYEEYLNGPEIKQRYEIVDGIMILPPGPSTGHQRVLGRMYKLLDAFASEQQLGEIFIAPLDVVIQREPLRTRQPDLLFVSGARADIVGQVIEGAPDLVVEILSPSNSRPAMEEKLADYARLEVQECWLMSPEAHSVEVMELGEGQGQRVGIFGLGDQVHSQVLPGMGLAVTEVFG